MCFEGCGEVFTIERDLFRLSYNWGNKVSKFCFTYFKLLAMGYKCNNNAVNNEHVVIVMPFFVVFYVCEINPTSSSQNYLSIKK